MWNIPFRELTEQTIRQFTGHIAGQHHAMAGATIASAGALACSLGEACVRISIMHLEAADQRVEAQHAADRLAGIRSQLQNLADEDGAAIVEHPLQGEGQDRLCRMPVEMASLSAEAATLLQDFRPLVRRVQDDMEMAITLLGGAIRGAILLLDSNLRIWPDPALLATYEPELVQLRGEMQRVHPVEAIRP
jgi:formiminotetrahydrofolate cyclodeaminase